MGTRAESAFLRPSRDTYHSIAEFLRDWKLDPENLKRELRGLSIYSGTNIE